MPTVCAVSGRRGAVRRGLALVATAVLGLIGLGAFWGSGMIGSAEEPVTSQERAPASTPGPIDALASGAVEEDTDAILLAIAELRTIALRDPQPGAEESYTVSGSPAASADAELMGRMRALDERYEGLRMSISADSAVEEITDEDGEGAVRLAVKVTSQPINATELERQHVVFELRDEDGRWMLYRVTPAAESPSG